MKLQDRIRKIVFDKTDNNYSEFCRITGLSNGFIYAITDQIQEKTLRKIIRAFPDVNENWVLREEGEMYKEVQDNSDTFYKESMQKLLDMLAMKDQMLIEKDRAISEKDKAIAERDKFIMNSLEMAG